MHDDIHLISSLTTLYQQQLKQRELFLQFHTVRDWERAIASRILGRKLKVSKYTYKLELCSIFSTKEVLTFFPAEGSLVSFQAQQLPSRILFPFGWEIGRLDGIFENQTDDISQDRVNWCCNHHDRRCDFPIFQNKRFVRCRKQRRCKLVQWILGKWISSLHWALPVELSSVSRIQE